MKFFYKAYLAISIALDAVIESGIFYTGFNIPTFFGALAFLQGRGGQYLSYLLSSARTFIKISISFIDLVKGPITDLMTPEIGWIFSPILVSQKTIPTYLH